MPTAQDYDAWAAKPIQNRIAIAGPAYGAPRGTPGYGAGGGGASPGSSSSYGSPAGPYGTYSKPNAPMMSWDVNDFNYQRRQGEANAMRSKEMQDAAIQAALRGKAGGIAGRTSYTDPTTGISYSFGPGAAGDDGGYTKKLPSMSELDPYLAQRVPRDPMPGRIKPPDKADRTAAEAAAYGRAKDLIGANAGGALKALQRSMSSRGIRGSGLEAAGLGNVIGGAQGQLGQVARDQAIEGLRRDYAVEDRNFAAELAQRTGDMSYLTNQRGQDINFETNRVSAIPALIRLMQSTGSGVAY
jgi:hypothetical protein